MTDITHLCGQTATVQTVSLSDDGAGTQQETWTDSLTGVAVRVVPMSAREAARHGGLPTTRLYKVYVADGSLDIDERDRLVIDSETYRIVGTRDPHSLGAFLVLECERLD